jgi:beta-galactosidase
MKEVDFSALPLGEKEFAGVLYDIYTFPTSPAPNVLMLSGFGSQVEADSIKGIEVGRRADALFFLHTYNPEKKVEQYDERMADLRAQPLGKGKREDMPEPPHVLTYVVHYADGQTEEVKVRWREEIGPWFSQHPRDLKNAALAWTAPIADRKGWKLAAYSMQWNNPRPDVPIESVDLKLPDVEQIESHGAPALLAITAARAPN